MRLLHSAARTHASFDDPSLVSCAGLVPVMRLAQACGLHRLLAGLVCLGTSVGTNPAGKITSIIAGMMAGADSIDDLDVVRHGGMPTLFGGVYAPSTLGSFLRAFTFGHVRQLGAVARQFLVQLAEATPLLAGAQAVTFVDVDSPLRRVYGKAKQGAGFGHTKVGGYPVLLRGLSPLIATLSTPVAAPVVAAARLRGGSCARTRPTTPRKSSPQHGAPGPTSASPCRSTPACAPRSRPSPSTPGPRSATRRQCGTRRVSAGSLMPRSPRPPTPPSPAPGTRSPPG